MKTRIIIFFLTIILSITSCAINSPPKKDVTPDTTIET